MRLATFNLLHGVSLGDGTADEGALRRAAAALDADVVGLQEVDRHQPRSGGVDQVRAVAEAVGAPHHRYVPALAGTPGPVRSWAALHGEEIPDGPTYGVGLVSRLPVLRWAARRFDPAPVSMPLLVPADPRPRLMRIPDEPRAAVAAVVDAPGGPLTVLTAHLSFVPGTNARQLRALARWARTFPAPRVLLGDFNLPGALPRLLIGWEQLGRVPTYPSYRPRVQFDHVLADGLPAGASWRVGAQRLDVSDHCALTVDLHLVEEAAGVHGGAPATER
ncbi:endonuclease/exonuclease/phosphatase family protein [Vallicoccus soli]|uniref:Endonuclease n=1 Tax=Vallicoccus soli TaxID=2339232 RepID=A0A3A3Z519_9ACTN|nr:endonuclease [Vallicoccus soli]